MLPIPFCIVSPPPDFLWAVPNPFPPCPLSLLFACLVLSCLHECRFTFCLVWSFALHTCCPPDRKAPVRLPCPFPLCLSGWGRRNSPAKQRSSPESKACTTECHTRATIFTSCSATCMCWATRDLGILYMAQPDEANLSKSVFWVNMYMHMMYTSRGHGESTTGNNLAVKPLFPVPARTFPPISNLPPQSNPQGV